jgi:hypothetical protein
MNEREPIVYFIQAGDAGPIKIGTTLNLTSRLSELQCGCPDELRVLGSIPGSHALESELHARFATHRYRGEWFVATRNLLNYIKRHTTIHTRALHDAIYPFEAADAAERARKGKRQLGDWVYEVGARYGI